MTHLLFAGDSLSNSNSVCNRNEALEPFFLIWQFVVHICWTFLNNWQDSPLPPIWGCWRRNGPQFRQEGSLSPLSTDHEDKFPVQSNSTPPPPNDQIYLQPCVKMKLLHKTESQVTQNHYTPVLLRYIWHINETLYHAHLQIPEGGIEK